MSGRRAGIAISITTGTATGITTGTTTGTAGRGQAGRGRAGRGRAGRGRAGRAVRLLVGGALALALAVSSGCALTRNDTRGPQPEPGSSGASHTPAPTPTYRMRPGVPQPVPGKVMLGSYLDLHGLSQAQSLALRRQQLGREQRIIHWFYEWDDVLPAKYRSTPSGAVVMLSWRAVRYDRILNGSQDKHIAASARNLARYGKPIFLRFAWEMNGGWYEWGGPRNGNDPAAFIAVWRRVYQIFQAQGADNVGWVWAPNFQSHPGVPWNDLRNYYPGDAYVDWVGVSGYSDATKMPEKIFNLIYSTYADRKPLIITETGIRKKGGRQSADWVDVLAQWFATHPAARGMVWFDTDTHKRGTDQFTNFRIDRDPLLLQAYRRLATDPLFSG